MSKVSERQYTGPADLRAMQSLAERIWSPASHCHIGDLAWQRFEHVGRELSWRTRLWEACGQVVAWGWADGGHLSLLVDPAWPELAGSVLDWAAPSEVMVLDGEKHVITALEQRGYRLTPDAPFHHYMSRSLGDLPSPVLPDGFVARPADDVARRVEVHRAAWHPSRVTVESYRNVMAAWPYRSSLDWAVEAPDGRFAAYCLIWLDFVNAVAELEPVGTDPAFRGMGLATAVCLAAMLAASQAGAKQAIVYPVDGYPAVELYRGLGFASYARTFTYRRP
ncbi:N-acetyltransferase [Kibdelosporangium aridum]|nr:GNAT family N-acetyltransferase [Kibdelosporangium aridum]